jgi:thiamine transport system permease protein
MSRHAIAPLFILAALALGLGPLVVFAIERGGVLAWDAYVWKVLRFTLLEATLSTLLSVGPAVFVARALARQRFWGRTALLTLFAVPLSLPVVVAVFGLAAVFGNAGILGGWDHFYGLGGIVVAHVFFNLPLATRLLLEALNTAAPESHKLAANLNFSGADVLRHVDWPLLQQALPRIAALVFLLCANSFVVVLMLGGPAATTLEVAIYQSLRMDFDVSRALVLTLVQVVFSAAMVWAAARALTTPNVLIAQHTASLRFDGQTAIARLGDATVVTLAMLLVLPVLLCLLWQGLQHIEADGTLVQATATSLALAGLSSLLALPLAWSLSDAQMRLPQRRGALIALSLAGYAVPPAALATGWFLALREYDGGITLAVFLIAVLNAMMAMPFLVSVLAPAFQHAALQNDRLCAELNLKGFNRLRFIDLPALRKPLAQALLMAVVLSMGDLTAVTMFGQQGLVTLPSLVQSQMGHYQSQAAGGTALVLGVICLVTTIVAQRLSRWT